MMTLPRDPIALAAARLAIGLMVLLAILALWPRQDAPLAPVVRAQAPIVVLTPQASPEPPAPQQAPIAQEAAPTAAPIIAQAPEAGLQSQLVQNADGSISLPGSEAWMAPQADAAPAADSVEQAAADAYRHLPTAAAPSEENAAPNRSRRPHTGR